jgi:hypothetical protein
MLFFPYVCNNCISFQSNYKANNTSILKTNLPSLMLGTFLPSSTRFWTSFPQKNLAIYLQKMFVISHKDICFV